MTDKNGTRPPNYWLAWMIGAVLLLGVIAPAVLWLAKFLWTHALRGLW